MNKLYVKKYESFSIYSKQTRNALSLLFFLFLNHLPQSSFLFFLFIRYAVVQFAIIFQATTPSFSSSHALSYSHLFHLHYSHSFFPTFKIVAFLSLPFSLFLLLFFRLAKKNTFEWFKDWSFCWRMDETEIDWKAMILLCFDSVRSTKKGSNVYLLNPFFIRK